MNRAQIYENLLKRNRLRLESKLPPLDIRAEYERECRAEALAEYHRVLRGYEHVKNRIKQEVRNEYQARGSDLTQTGMGNFALNRETIKRFERFMEINHGIIKP